MILYYITHEQQVETSRKRNPLKVYNKLGLSLIQVYIRSNRCSQPLEHHHDPNGGHMSVTLMLLLPAASRLLKFCSHLLVCPIFTALLWNQTDLQGQVVNRVTSSSDGDEPWGSHSHKEGAFPFEQGVLFLTGYQIILNDLSSSLSNFLPQD